MIQKFNTKNAKGVLYLLTGNTISKFILTVGGIVFAKLYGPEQYGVYSVFLGYILVLSIIGSLRLENILILETKVKKIKNIFSSSFYIVPLILFFCTLVLLFVKLSFNLSSLDTHLLLLCGFSSILVALRNVHTSLLHKYKKFIYPSYIIIVIALFSILGQGFFYYLGYKTNGLIYGWIFGAISSFLFALGLCFRRITKANLTLLKESLKEHKKVLFYTYPSDFINSLANNLLPILAISYFSAQEIGNYALSLKLITTPLVLLSASFSKVYFQKAVSLKGKDEKLLFQTTKKVILTNFILMLMFLIFLNTLGIYLLESFFGEKWASVKGYLLILSFWGLTRSLITPIANVFLVINKNQVSLIFNIYLLIVNFTAIIVGIKLSSFIYSISIFSVFSGMGYLFLFFLIVKNLKYK